MPARPTLRRVRLHRASLCRHQIPKGAGWCLRRHRPRLGVTKFHRVFVRTDKRTETILRESSDDSVFAPYSNTRLATPMRSPSGFDRQASSGVSPDFSLRAFGSAPAANKRLLLSGCIQCVPGLDLQKLAVRVKMESKFPACGPIACKDHGSTAAAGKRQILAVRSMLPETNWFPEELKSSE